MRITKGTKILLGISTALVLVFTAPVFATVNSATTVWRAR